MKKIKDNLLLILVSIVIILLVVIILLLLNVKIFSSSNNVDNKESNTKDTKEIKKDDNTNIVDPTQSTTPDTDPIKVDDIKPIPSTPVQDVVPNLNVDKNENNVVKFFEEKSNAIKSGDSKTLREKAKDGFVTAVDFIFYDKEVKGYKFKELTNNAKLKIISIALSIDNKIDTYFPGYKDEIKGKYNNIKTKLAEKYLEYSAKLCESVGEETCNSAKEGWTKLKESFSLTGDFLKDVGKDAGEKIKNWYESFRDN